MEARGDGVRLKPSLDATDDSYYKAGPWVGADCDSTPRCLALGFSFAPSFEIQDVAMSTFSRRRGIRQAPRCAGLPDVYVVVCLLLGALMIVWMIANR